MSGEFSRRKVGSVFTYVGYILANYRNLTMLEVNTENILIPNRSHPYRRFKTDLAVKNLGTDGLLITSELSAHFSLSPEPHKRLDQISTEFKANTGFHRR